MFKKLTLKNDFHNTEANFRVEANNEIKLDDVITLSKNQVNKAKRLLCWKDCACSGELGTRADWHVLDGEEVKFEEHVIYDQRTGELLGVELYVRKIWKG